MGNQHFLQTSGLAKLIFRRDRVRLSIWIISFFIVTMLTAVMFDDIYPSQEERQNIAQSMDNPAVTALIGKGYGLDNYTNGAMMAHQMLAFTLLIIAIMSVLLVVRHTRADEEEGRVELIRSLPTGRLSNLMSTLLVMSITYAVLALITGVGLYSLGMDSMGLEGSLLYGAALGVTGIFFAATTALCAQLAETSKGAMGLSFLIVGLSYLIRAIGDVMNESISWFSPFGWVLASQVYVNNYWWTILLTLIVAIIIAGTALYLNAVRDLGAGFLPTRSGKRNASKFSQSLIGLNFRLQKTSVISWAVVLFIFGATYGSVLGDTDAYFAEIEMMKEFMSINEGQPLTLQFVTMIASIMAILSTIPVVMSLFKIKKEEKRNRLEQVLATATSKYQLLGSYLLVSLITSAIMFTSGALGLSVAGASTIDDSISFAELFNAIIVYLPAAWVLVGVGTLFMGIGRWNGMAWLYLGFAFVVVYFGGILKFSDWIKNISPYDHISKVPLEDFSVSSFLVLTLLALMLMFAGLILFRKRDIKG